MNVVLVIIIIIFISIIIIIIELLLNSIHVESHLSHLSLAAGTIHVLPPVHTFIWFVIHFQTNFC